MRSNYTTFEYVMGAIFFGPDILGFSKFQGGASMIAEIENEFISRIPAEFSWRLHNAYRYSIVQGASRLL